MQEKIKTLYKEIQTLLIKLVPENWKSICLYASVLEGRNGEMYFYCFPKKIIKANPINCYEIPEKYGIDENIYEKSLKRLYGYIKNIHMLSNKKWTNITIVMNNSTFTIEYHYNNLINSKYNDEQRRIVWCQKYLNLPLESLNFKDRLLIEGYKEEGRCKSTIYSEKLHIEENSEEGTKCKESIESTKVAVNPFLKY